MREGKTNKMLLTLLLAIGYYQSNAQLVPVYSQYLVNQTIINPAYVGANNALNINALYRQQWAGYDGAPSTRTISAHTPLRNRALAVGLNVVNDVISITSNTLLEGQFAYRFKLTDAAKLSLGIGAGLFINKNNLAGLKVNDAGDEVFTNNSNSVMPTFSFGVHYENRKFFAGLSSLNLTRSFSSQHTFAYQQPIYLLTGYNYRINETFTLTPSLLLKKVNGNPLQLDLNMFLNFKELFKIGASFRTSEALYAIVQVKLNPQFQLGYSYDYSLSALRKYQKGSHEVSVRYVFEYKTNTVDVKSFE